jgi:hypothetical protein
MQGERTMHNAFRNMDQKHVRYLGISLIVLGVLALLNWWGLIPVLILGSVGAHLYTQRRLEGRVPMAVQSGLWLIGMAVLFLLNFIFPGILLLAGASLLVRGHEHEADQRVVNVMRRLGVHLSPTPARGMTAASAAPTIQQTPADQTAAGTSSGDQEPSTGKTVRL